jgi:hypothetical protein
MTKSFATIVVMGALSPLAGGTLLYQQPSIWSGNGSTISTGYTDEESSAGTGFQTFDDFTLSAGGIVNQVSWVGLYINGTMFLNEPPNTTSWDIDFYADNSGVPGSLLASTNLSTAQVTSQILGTGQFGGATFTIYDFIANIPGFSASADTTYWFSPFSHNPDETAKFIWIDGSGGDDAEYQNRLTDGSVSGSFDLTGDRAFSLSNVPEPMTALPVGAGIVLLFGLARRRRPSPPAPRENR